MTAENKDLEKYAEPKAQRWRIIAEINAKEPDNIALVCLGSSITQIRENYQSAFFSVLEEEVQKKTKRLILQRFEGVPDCGHWSNQDHFQIPKTKKQPSHHDS